MTMRSISRTGCLFAALLGTMACDRDSEPSPSIDASFENTTVGCFPGDPPQDAGTWICPEPRTIECGSVPPPLYVQGCASPVVETDAAPRTPGPHVISVTGADGGIECETVLTVVDTMPPSLVPRTTSLWPPNHKLHVIDTAACVHVEEACAGAITAEFTWISSDEAIDGVGAGNKGEADVVIDDCSHVQLRAEREGGGDGRVYRLGVRVIDGAGHAVEGTCSVEVAHDQGDGAAIDSGEVYRISLDGRNGTPVCGG